MWCVCNKSCVVRKTKRMVFFIVDKFHFLALNPNFVSFFNFSFKIDSLGTLLVWKIPSDESDISHYTHMQSIHRSRFLDCFDFDARLIVYTKKRIVKPKWIFHLFTSPAKTIHFFIYLIVALALKKIVHLLHEKRKEKATHYMKMIMINKKWWWWQRKHYKKKHTIRSQSSYSKIIAMCCLKKIVSFQLFAFQFQKIWIACSFLRLIKDHNH